MAQVINGTAGPDTLTGTNGGDPANADGIDTINGAGRQRRAERPREQ